MQISYLDILFLKFQMHSRKRKIAAISTIFLLTLAAYGILRNYLIADFNLWLGLIFFPIILYIKDNENTSNRFGYISLAILALYAFIPVATLFYLSYGFAVLFIIENSFGKINYGSVLLVFIIGSITRYFINIFSFSIRLKLTQIAGSILNIAGFENTVYGNIINHGNYSFSVDYECIGIKMVVTSFVLMLFFITIFERRNRMSLSFAGILGLSLINFMLIVLTNLMRIIVLIVFRSEPGSFSHEFIGILSLLIYNLIPVYFITPLVINLAGKKVIPAKIKKIRYKFIFPVLLTMNLAGLIFFSLSHKDKVEITNVSNISVPGYKTEILENQVIKLYNDSSLVYIKACPDFYGSEHNPYICWKGSGYEFRNILEKKYNKHEIYTAKLESADGNFYTAWWFTDGKHITNSQIDWRYHCIKGEGPYKLVNVSSKSEAGLHDEINKFLNTDFYD